MPQPECPPSDGETEAWAEQCGPKPAVQAPSARSACDHPPRVKVGREGMDFLR